MTTLYLHIGSNKTATTTLQHRFSRSAEILLGAGILYPSTGQSKIGAHHILGGYLRPSAPPRFKPRGEFSHLLDSLDHEVHNAREHHDAKDVIISSEMLFWRKLLDEESLQTFLARFDEVKVIVYLRRQDDYLASFYNSLIRNGDRPPAFKDFCLRQNLSYLDNLQRWSEQVGSKNLLAKPFVAKFWLNGSIADDFLHLFTSTLCEGDLEMSEPHNEALPLEVIELLSATGNSQEIENPYEFQKFLVGAFAEVRKSAPTTLMTESIYQSLRERYDAENRQLGECFFEPPMAEALAFEAHYHPPAAPYQSLQIQELAQVLVRLWNQQRVNPTSDDTA